MSSSTSTSTLPSGLAVLTTFPDVLFIPEIVSAAFSPGEGWVLLQVSEGWHLSPNLWLSSHASSLSHEGLGAAHPRRKAQGGRLWSSPLVCSGIFRVPLENTVISCRTKWRG